jgi:hypothetical protein
VDRLSRTDTMTAFFFVFLWLIFMMLSAILVAALLTDWPSFLHERSSYGAAVHNYDLAAHETIPLAYHEGCELC